VQALAPALALTLTLNYLANKPQQMTPAHCSYQVRDELLMNVQYGVPPHDELM